MIEKRLVTRQPSGKAHKYYAAVAEVKVQGSLVRELVDRAFGGAARNLVLHALSECRPSAEEMVEIRTLLDKFEKDSSC
jgi:predicted transcriptional regulator